MSDKKPHRAKAKARLANLTVKRGYALPASHRSTPAMVVWRARGCRCRLLSVYLSPDGWVVDGEDFKVGMDEWIERINPDGTAEVEGIPVTLENYRAGLFGAFGPGKVSGVQEVLDLDPDTWTPGSFEVGCDDGHKWVPVSDLADDVRQVRATRSPLDNPRWVEW